MQEPRAEEACRLGQLSAVAQYRALCAAAEQICDVFTKVTLILGICSEGLAYTVDLISGCFISASRVLRQFDGRRGSANFLHASSCRVCCS